MTTGKFLGLIVHQKGIKANPKKIHALSTKNIKGVQTLTGKVVALNRFVSRSSDKCQLYFYAFDENCEWTVKCEEAFKNLKEHFDEPPSF